MSYPTSTVRQSRLEMYQKGLVQPVFASRMSVTAYRPGFDSSELNDTDFEEDLSDLEEYSGRRSEDSMGKHSDTTLSSYDELRTPENLTSNAFDAFNFQLEAETRPKKAVEGPVGPHLFRMSQESSQDVNFYLSMSPPASPEEARRAGPDPVRHRATDTATHDARQSGVPLQTWSPRQVAEWMYSRGFERSIIEQFFRNDISGVTLIDLQYEDLKELGITSFGQRHRLWTEIRALKDSSRGGPLTPPEDICFSPVDQKDETFREMTAKKCSSPESPDEDQARSPTTGRRRNRRARQSDDIISPAESASIVAIEQLLPKPHKCSKGENCSKWQKQQRKLARIATEFPLELAQITEAKGSGSPAESGMGATSIIVPSVVASSDLLGPSAPPVRLEENNLRVVQMRDPQENVRQFISFQHLNQKPVEEPGTPPYEMFPKLSPIKTQPHSNLRSLPKLTIPSTKGYDAFSPNRTAVPRRQKTPVTATERNPGHDIWRLGSPASEMDVPVTAIHMGPIERDVSSSVPPDMRYGGAQIPRSSSRLEHRQPNPNAAMSPSQKFSPIKRSTSHSGHRRRPSFNMDSVLESEAPTVIDDLTPTGEDYTHAGWMKKRKTKMLRHEWQDNHFRLNGTRLAMHKDEKTADAIDYIDVDDYAVACSSLNSGKINTAFKRLAISGKKKENDAAAFTFQLTPAAEKKGMLSAATGKTHHFAVKTATERIDWMRELLVAKALKQKDMVHSSF